MTNPDTLTILQDIRDELKRLNVNVESLHSAVGTSLTSALQESPVIRQLDWKLWIITNCIVDALMKEGSLTEDPRLGG